jgi:hypothetical protein
MDKSVLRKKLTLALILYLSLPSHWFIVGCSERMRCAVVKMMPVLLSSSHFMHTPQHLASGFPSANIDQKITTLGQPLAPSANINQQARCYNIRTDIRWEHDDRFGRMKHRLFCSITDGKKMPRIIQAWFPWLVWQSEETVPTTYRELCS